MAKVALADVLWEAANEHLWVGFGNNGWQTTPYTGSCCATAYAQKGAWDGWGDASKRSSVEFLRALGCDTSGYFFEGFSYGRARQGVRYMWLLLAMHVAEDEGIYIEVAK